jgi:hypothetical protein
VQAKILIGSFLPFSTVSAHRDISRRRSNSVGFGAKQTFSEPRLQNRICESRLISQA